jgi:N-acyl-D-aspartate/D-glutamate deacylase
MAQYDILIRGGHIIDGNGTPPYVGDVAIHKTVRSRKSARSRAMPRA